MLWADLTGAKETMLRSDLLVRGEERGTFSQLGMWLMHPLFWSQAFQLLHHNPALQQGHTRYSSLYLTFLKSKTQS